MGGVTSSESRRIEYYARFSISGRRRGRSRDAAVYGLLRIRQGGLMRLSTDLENEYQPRRPIEYY